VAETATWQKPPRSIVAKGVLPIPALPNSALPTAARLDLLLNLAREFPRKSSLDQAPAQREISIARRQRPNGTINSRTFGVPDGGSVS
jgi:hypothetical protein